LSAVLAAAFDRLGAARPTLKGAARWDAVAFEIAPLPTPAWYRALIARAPLGMSAGSADPTVYLACLRRGVTLDMPGRMSRSAVATVGEGPADLLLGEHPDSAAARAMRFACKLESLPRYEVNAPLAPAEAQAHLPRSQAAVDAPLQDLSPVHRGELLAHHVKLLVDACPPGAPLPGEVLEEVSACAREAWSLTRPTDWALRAAILAQLGHAQARAGAVEASLVTYARGVTLLFHGDPRSRGGFHVGLANALGKRGDLLEAEGQWRRGMALDPKGSYARAGLLGNLLQRGLLDEASEVAEAAPRRAWRDEGVAGRAIRLALGRNRLEVAQARVQASQEELDASPPWLARLADEVRLLGRATPAYERGLALVEDDPKGAEAAFSEAIHTYPRFSAALRAMARLRGSWGSWEAVHADYERAQRALNHLDGSLILERCRAFLEDGRPEAALHHATYASRQASTVSDAHHALGLALAALGRRSEARAAFTEALRLDPARTDAREQLEALQAASDPGSR
jgi:tetratricopeptide (TPR) repeat protein